MSMKSDETELATPHEIRSLVEDAIAQQNHIDRAEIAPVYALSAIALELQRLTAALERSTAATSQLIEAVKQTSSVQSLAVLTLHLDELTATVKQALRLVAP